MISAVIITLNEERIIARCLRALEGVVDEIIVVDSHSSDRTVEICKQMGAKVILHTFEGYRTQKNFACDSAKHQWILSLDADEVLSDELRNSLLQWRENHKKSDKYPPEKGQIVGYSFNRITDYCGTWVRHGGWYPDSKMRFYQREFGRWSGRNVHEFVEIKAGFSTSKLSGDLLHYSIPEQSELLRKLFTYSEMGARFMHEEGRKSSYLESILRCSFRFIRQTIFQHGFLDGKLGITIARYNASATFWKYRRLLAMNESKYHKIKIIASTCPEEAMIVSNAIKWFDKTSKVSIHSKYEGIVEIDSYDAVVILDEIFDNALLSKKTGAASKSVKILKITPSNNIPLALRSLKLLHKLHLPAALRFPDKKDWDLLS
jgi:glycosyltransferase involved in cell wall biosynthesis